MILLVLPRLYERLCEEKINDDEDEADSSHTGKRPRSLSARMLSIFTLDRFQSSSKMTNT